MSRLWSGEVLGCISCLAGAQPEARSKSDSSGRENHVFCRKEQDFKDRQEVHAYNPSAWEAEV